VVSLWADPERLRVYDSAVKAAADAEKLPKADWDDNQMLGFVRDSLNTHATAVMTGERAADLIG